MFCQVHTGGSRRRRRAQIERGTTIFCSGACARRSAWSSAGVLSTSGRAGTTRRGRAPTRAGISDRGFSLIEVVVALAVLSIVLVSVGQVLASQVTVTTTTKNQAVAQGLLTKTLAALRVLPFQDLSRGLDASDTTTGTSHIVKTGATWVFSDTKEPRDGTGETVLHSTPGTTAPPPMPLYPHVNSRMLNGSRFSVAVFPTQFETPPLHTPSHTAALVPGLIRATVVVSWLTGTGRSATLTGQTLISTTGRCDETTGTTGPCKPNFTAVATAGFGTITVARVDGGVDPIAGVSFTSIALVLGGTSSSGQLVRTSLVSGRALTTGATSSGGGGGGATSSVLTQVSNDPALGDPTFQALALTQTATPVSIAGSGNSITSTPSVGDTGASMGTTSATATQKCLLLDGTALSTSTPCGSGAVRQASTASIAADLQGAGLGTVTLATVGSQSTRYPTRAVTDRVGPGQNAGPGKCLASATSGCTGAEAQESLGTVMIGGLPSSVTSPSGWSSANALITLSDYSARATSATDSGSTGPHTTAKATVPIPTAPSPQLTYWNGSGYTTTALTGSAPAITVPKVTAQDASAPGGAVTVSMTTVLSVDAISTQQSTTPSCKTPCRARMTVPSPIQAVITYQAVQGSTVICDFTITVNLGSVVATTSYQAAS